MIIIVVLQVLNSTGDPKYLCHFRPVTQIVDQATKDDQQKWRVPEITIHTICEKLQNREG